MFGLRRFGIKLGLSTMRFVLEGLGNPHHQYRCIHVAGTNGKGSIASTLACILHRAGYHVGLYTSPHLVRFNERIQVDLKQVDDDSVIEAYETVKRVCPGDREPTFFEYTTAMAFYEFKKEQVDWAVIETGMGGRLDATNVILPEVSIISNISLEHQSYLGDTLEKIAREKGGIIKEKKPLVTGVTQESVIRVLREISENLGSPFYRLGESFRIRKNRHTREFSYHGVDVVWKNLQLGLAGDHQYENAALVLAACEILSAQEVKISLEDIRRGLMENVWPGRLEIVLQKPMVILDGAHNLMAARKLSKYLAECMASRRLTMVIGILDDKPYKAMLETFAPLCARIILTQPKIDRALPCEQLLGALTPDARNIRCIPDVAEAVRYAVDTAAGEDAVCIAGSLYVVGEAKSALARLKPSGDIPSTFSS